MVSLRWGGEATNDITSTESSPCILRLCGKMAARPYDFQGPEGKLSTFIHFLLMFFISTQWLLVALICALVGLQVMNLEHPGCVPFRLDPSEVKGGRVAR